MSDRTLEELLSNLGIAFGDEQEARTITVLRAVLNATKEAGQSCTFGEIFQNLQGDKEGLQVSKAWVHRILKSLVDTQLIRLESPGASRNRYIATVETVATGLEALKEKRESEIMTQITMLQQQMDTFLKIDSGFHAEKLVEKLVGERQALSSRFIRDMQELQRILVYNIHNPAREGDIIRMSMMWLGPFALGLGDRAGKYFDAIKRGAEVRWMASADLMLGDESGQVKMPIEDAQKMFAEIISLHSQGYKVDARIQFGPPTYNATVLNNDCIVMIISDDPMTATFVTKEFNQDLIDDAVNAIDLHWENAISLVDLDLEKLKKSGLMKSKFVAGLLKAMSDDPTG